MYTPLHVGYVYAYIGAPIDVAIENFLNENRVGKERLVSIEFSSYVDDGSTTKEAIIIYTD